MDYKGIKISDTVIIVARHVFATDYDKTPGLIPQGYVVDKGNKKMLETALNWAERTQYDITLDTWEERQKTAQIIPGDQFEYPNGQFKITLCESANCSSQGGKLSFWDCLITAEDGKKFIIGINSELLLHLLKSNTLVNGECQDKVWLGRVKGNQVGAFSENMEEFKQAKLDAKSRSAKKSTTYTEGDIVETLTTRELYLGEMYLYGKELNIRSLDYSREVKRHLVLYNKPKKVYAYLPIYINNKDKTTFYGSRAVLRLKKAARIVTAATDIAQSNLVKSLVDNFTAKCDKLNYVLDSAQTGYNYFYDTLSNIVVKTTANAKKETIIEMLLKLGENSSKIRSYTIVTEANLKNDYKNQWDIINSMKFSNEFAFFNINYLDYLKK